MWVILIVIVLVYILWWLWRVTKSVAQIERILKNMANGYDSNFTKVSDRIEALENKHHKT